MTIIHEQIVNNICFKQLLFKKSIAVNIEYRKTHKIKFIISILCNALNINKSFSNSYLVGL